MTGTARRSHVAGLVPAILLLLWATASAAASSDVVRSEAATFRIETLVRGLQIPWAIAFLSDDMALVSERAAGRISLVDLKSGTLSVPVGGPDDVFVDENAGMLDVVLHPEFSQNGYVYFCYTAGDAELNTTVVERARYADGKFTRRERLFAAVPWFHNSIVYGCRLVFRDTYLFISMGDRWDLRHLAQSAGSHLGKILRLHDDGRAPHDNPYVGVPGALPEVWSIGHRNPQGLTVHPDTREIWSHEHGPLGGDEVNVLHWNGNFGWPIITYGKEYSGEPVGDGLTEKPGLEQPVYTYVPSIAPSDMFFYSGSAFPGWRGDLFIGALALRHINRLTLDGVQVIHEERLLEDMGWRVRFVSQGPDELLYFGTDDGEIHRLVPAPE